MDPNDPINPTLTVPCACGCGTLLPLLNKRGEPSKFVRGHSRRGVRHTDEARQKMADNHHKSQTAPSIPTVLCACGCGTEVPALNKRGEAATFAHGHNRRNADVKPETRAKLSARTTEHMHKKFGPPSHPWKRYGTTPGYKQWRLDVLKRDDYTCQSCGKKLRPCFLHAHHLKSWAEFPELRLALVNGVTLCVCCHNRVHNWEVSKEPEPCACGCGENAAPGRKFLHGHWARLNTHIFTHKGHKHTIEARRKMSESHLARGVPPGRGEAISKAKKGKPIKSSPKSAKHRQSLSTTKKRQYEDPEFAARMGQSIHEAWLRKQAEQPPAYCECGCGGVLPPRAPGRTQTRFLRGHQSKGKSPSAEARARMSESAKKRRAKES